MRSKRHLVAALLLYGAIAISPKLTAQETYSEDAVKAAFLYRFTDYVDWPADALQSPVFTIAVLNDPAVEAQLERLQPAHPIHGRSVQIQSLTSVRDLRNAQMLYVGGHDSAELRRVVMAVGSRPVLVVTDYDSALNSGSVVNFVLMDRRLRFEVSLDAADQLGLRIGSELLSVAVRVQGRRPVGVAPEEDSTRQLYLAQQ
jgi:hypothetical protein